MYHRRQILREGRGLTESVRKRNFRTQESREKRALGLGLLLLAVPRPGPGGRAAFLFCADPDETRNIEKISGKPKIPRALSCLHPLRYALVLSRPRPPRAPGPRLLRPPRGPCSLPVQLQAPPVASVPVSRARSSGIKIWLTKPNDRLLLSYSTYSLYTAYMCVYLHTYHSTCPLTDLLVGYCVLTAPEDVRLDEGGREEGGLREPLCRLGRTPCCVLPRLQWWRPRVHAGGRAMCQ